MYFVYLIITQSKKKITSYVGYTSNLKKRILMHNSSKGAKFTRGRYWKLIYYKEYKTKKTALKEEYKLKNNFNLRNNIKKNYIKNENFNIITL
jgi:putative endonuclease